MQGIVSGRLDAIVKIRFRGPTGIESSANAIVDTGFNGALTLPKSVVSLLGLMQSAEGTGQLADGSTSSYGIYEMEIEWNGTFRGILVSAVGNGCLIGMRLLQGSEIRIEVRPGGAVEITKL